MANNLTYQLNMVNTHTSMIEKIINNTSYENNTEPITGCNYLLTNINNNLCYILNYISQNVSCEKTIQTLKDCYCFFKELYDSKVKTHEILSLVYSVIQMFLDFSKKIILTHKIIEYNTTSNKRIKRVDSVCNFQ